MALVLILRPAGITGGREVALRSPHAPTDGEGRSGMRICVVGCGAVGSLFAANLATLDDVEVWAFDLNKAHIDAIKKNGLQLTGAGEVVGRPNATARPGAICPRATTESSRRRQCTPTRAIAATAHAFADGAVASVMNGVGNEETLARMSSA